MKIKKLIEKINDEIRWKECEMHDAEYEIEELRELRKYLSGLKQKTISKGKLETIEDEEGYSILYLLGL